MSRLATSLLAFTLVPVGLVGLPVVASPSSAAQPVAVDVRSQPVQLPEVAAAAVEGVVGAEEAPGRFTTVGLSWVDGTGTSAVLSVRTRAEDGGWRPWEDVETTPAETEVFQGRRSTNPVFTGVSDRVQVRVRGPRPDRLEVVTVDPGTAKTDADPSRAGVLGGAGSTATAAMSAPQIISRAQWGADESLRTYNAGCDGTASYAGSLKAGTLHHTAGSNAYTKAESAGILRADYAYHVKTRGWCDIGYNFVVDKYGQIFEGRWGGVSRPVIGAHVAGYNTGNVGVSMIGNYETASPTAAGLEAAAQVFAYKFALHRLDPRASTTLNDRTVSTLNAHRDLGQTACPGRNLYPQMTSLRSRVAALIGATPSFDLYPVKVGSTGSGNTELHPLSGMNDYGSFSAHIATAFADANSADWRFLTAPYDGSGRPDLFGIKLRGTASGKMEVHVLSAASGYRQFVLHRATAQPALPPMVEVDIAVGSYGGDRRSNVYVIEKQATGSGTVEVHVLSAASSYTSFLLHSASKLKTWDVQPGQWDFFIGDAAGSGDLVGIHDGAGTGSGKSDMHTLSRTSGYRTFTRQIALPFARNVDDRYSWVFGDEDGDDVPDLVLVIMNRTISGRTEVVTAYGATGYRTTSALLATPLEATSSSRWQFTGW